MKRIVTVLYQNPVEREQVLSYLKSVAGLECQFVRLSHLNSLCSDHPLICWCSDLPFGLWIKEQSYQPLLLLHSEVTKPLFALLEDGRCACVSIADSPLRLEEQLHRLFRRSVFVAQTATYLTKREHEVVQLVASGLNTAQIAHRLKIKRSTVTSHKKRIFLKSGVRNSGQLVAWALLKSQRDGECEGTE